MSEPPERDGPPEDDPRAAGGLDQVDLEAHLARRPPARVRALRAGLTALVMVVALATVVRVSLAPLGVAPAPARPVATPTPATAVLVVSSVTYGTLWLNGRRLPGPPPQSVFLRTGKNTVTLDAPPFPTRTCAVLGPVPTASYAAPGDHTPGCEVADGESSVGPGPAVTSYTAYLTLSGDDLAPDLRRGAQDAVAGALAALPPLTATVPAGDYYATGADASGLPTSQLAAAPLTATVTYSLLAPSADGSGLQDCLSGLCSSSIDPSQGVMGAVWEVGVPIQVHWRFAFAAGQVAAEDLAPAPSSAEVALAYAGGVSWRVVELPVPAPVFADPCGMGSQLLAGAEGPDAGGSGISGAEATGGSMQGCTLQTRAADGSVQATFIYRWGVLLAADAAAHRLLPGLPVAPPQELAALQR